MDRHSLVDRLAALPALASVARSELEWLAAHGEVQRFEGGTVIYSSEHPPPACYILLSGRLSLRVTRDGVARTVRELAPGAVAGRLPYSRMPRAADDVPGTAPQFASVADEAVEILLLAGQDVREIARECYDFTAICVHEMVDRTRLFKSADLERERMAALGRLAAGLAHELNNPSSAAARSAREMDACRLDVVAATRALGRAGLTDGQMRAVERLEAAAGQRASAAEAPLERADREQAVADWLEGRGLDPALADVLAGTSLAVAHLDELAAVVGGPRLVPALQYVAANAAARQLTTEIEHAATRIHTLVTAVKKHTHMDRAPTIETIRVGEGLAEILTIVKAKAAAKAVAVVLEVEPSLPPVRGLVAELNEVWLHLIDNAIDAVADGGRVVVAAARRDDCVVVTVADDGPGITEADQGRIFEPFFTTKAVGQGTGLGLDIVQGSVRAHGGSIEVRSRPGSTEFRVTLPAAGSGTA